MFFALPWDYVLGMLVWLALLGGAAVGLMRRRRANRRASKRLAWIHAGLSLWMLLVALTLCELSFALFVDMSDAFNMTNLSKRWFRRHVDAQRNQFGARDVKEFPRTVPQGVRRIAFLGDSFTIGHGVPNREDRFSDRVQVMLDKARPGEFVVANLGDPGLEISQIDARLGGLLNEGCDLSIAIYVVCLNDIEAYDPRTNANIARLQQIEPRFFLLRRTYFFNWLYFRYQQFSRPEVRDYFSWLSDSYNSRAWEPFRTHLDSLNERSKSAGTEFRVVIFPFLHDLGPDYPFTAAHRKIAEHCREAKIPVLDLEPVFREHADEHLTVNRYDSHPNERAHEIAAEAIYKQLLGDLTAADSKR